MTSLESPMSKVKDTAWVKGCKRKATLLCLVVIRECVGKPGSSGGRSAWNGMESETSYSLAMS